MKCIKLFYNKSCKDKQMPSVLIFDISQGVIKVYKSSFQVSSPLSVSKLTEEPERRHHAFTLK